MKFNQGFTLIEALVTVLVMSVGLLGFATLQNTSNKFTYDAFLRTQSSLLANDLFDRMRANPSVNYTNIDAATNTDCSQTDCDPFTMYAFDMTQWRSARDALFPVASTTTTLSTNNTSDTYTISFLWDSRTEDGDRITDTQNAEGRQQVSYSARVK